MQVFKFHNAINHLDSMCILNISTLLSNDAGTVVFIVPRPAFPVVKKVWIEFRLVWVIFIAVSQLVCFFQNTTFAYL